MNRKDRRAQAKSQKSELKRRPLFKGLSIERRVEGLVQNGLTLDDLVKEHDRGYQEGISEASRGVVRMCYAAVCLALKEEPRPFGAMRCSRVLNRMYFHMLNSLTSEEAIDEVWDKMRLNIDFDEVLGDPVTVREK